MSSSNMNVGGRRQLPSWMVRTTVTEQANVSKTKEDNKENDSVKHHSKVVEPLKKKLVHDNGVSSIGNELQTLKKCEARTRKRKSNKLEEGQGERFEEDELCLLKPCKESRNKRMATRPKLGEDRVESDLEKKEDGVVRKRVRNTAPRKNHSEKLLGKIPHVTAESGPSDDELTVEDLVSIAEEYVKSVRTNFQKSKVDQDTKCLHGADTHIGLGKHLTTHRENSLVNDQPLSDSTLTKPLSGEGHTIDLSTFDPTRNMIDLLLGPRRHKNSEEVVMKTDSVTQKIKLDYELSKKSHNDTITEVAPVMKKKSSLKDKIRSFVD